jgi:hypothetical protein
LKAIGSNSTQADKARGRGSEEEAAIITMDQVGPIVAVAMAKTFLQKVKIGMHRQEDILEEARRGLVKGLEEGVVNTADRHLFPSAQERVTLVTEKVAGAIAQFDYSKHEFLPEHGPWKGQLQELLVAECFEWLEEGLVDLRAQHIIASVDVLRKGKRCEWPPANLVSAEHWTEIVTRMKTEKAETTSYIEENKENWAARVPNAIAKAGLGAWIVDIMSHVDELDKLTALVVEACEGLTHVIRDSVHERMLELCAATEDRDETLRAIAAAEAAAVQDADTVGVTCGLPITFSITNMCGGREETSSHPALGGNEGGFLSSFGCGSRPQAPARPRAPSVPLPSGGQSTTTSLALPAARESSTGQL